MANHPNRNKKADQPGAVPKPQQIVAARVAAGLTQTEAARLVYCSLRAWQQWEAGDRTMQAGLWELFRTKANVEIRA